MARLRIAQVAASDLSIRFLLLDHLQALQQAGHDVVAICGPGPWVEKVRTAGVPVETVAMARELSPSRDMRSLLALKRLFRERRFDVVHTHTPKAGLLGPLAARLAGVPVVVHTIHGLMFHDRVSAWRRRLFWLPERVTAMFTTHLLSQSSEDLGVALSSGLCGRQKIRYLGNGIDVTQFRPRPRDGVRRPFDLKAGEVVVGSVGRLVYEKGFAELFAAADQLRGQGIRFLVVGPREHDQKDAVPAGKIRELTDSGAVLFADWRDDMAHWYSIMDMFVLPSHREGVPRACMEAAAMSLPVIASDIRGCREVVKNDETGLLVPVRDPTALAKAIERLAADPATRRRMGENGRQHIVDNFDHRQVLQRLLNFYDEIEAGLGRRTARA